MAAGTKKPCRPLAYQNPWEERPLQLHLRLFSYASSQIWFSVFSVIFELICSKKCPYNYLYLDVKSQVHTQEERKEGEDGGKGGGEFFFHNSFIFFLQSLASKFMKVISDIVKDYIFTI